MLGQHRRWLHSIEPAYGLCIVLARIVTDCYYCAIQHAILDEKLIVFLHILLNYLYQNENKNRKLMIQVHFKYFMKLDMCNT